MTNEKLAELIGQGGNDELLPLLWEKMRRFYRLCSNKYAAGHSERCARCGITAEDIFQECYFAMLDGIQAYNSRAADQTALHFISFCGYPFKNRAAALLGLRTKQAYKEPLNGDFISLDEPLTDKDGGQDTSRGELIPDETAQRAFRDIEQADYCRAVRETVQSVLQDSPEELEVLQRVYYYGATISGTGKAMGISNDRVRSLEHKALRQLRSDHRVQELYGMNPYRSISYPEFIRKGSIVEQIVERRDSFSKKNRKRGKNI